jgi:Histidinol-phosphate/aromatic aminotransferase and cobyric acid decarboxylase
MNLPKPIKFEVERYIGGLSQFKNISNPIKLSANESALGPSPKAIEVFEKEKNKIFKYPESDSTSLREVLSDKFKIDSQRIICGSGSDQIFDLTCRLFIQPGDEVIVTEFGFIMHTNI